MRRRAGGGKKRGDTNKEATNKTEEKQDLNLEDLHVRMCSFRLETTRRQESASGTEAKLTVTRDGRESGHNAT